MIYQILTIFRLKCLTFCQKTTTINVFSGKFMYFRANFKKNQEKPKVLSKTLEKTQGPQKKNQEPKIASKNPRSWEKTQAVATLALRKQFRYFDIRSTIAEFCCVKIFCIGCNNKAEFYVLLIHHSSSSPYFITCFNSK